MRILILLLTLTAVQPNLRAARQDQIVEVTLPDSCVTVKRCTGDWHGHDAEHLHCDKLMITFNPACEIIRVSK